MKFKNTIIALIFSVICFTSILPCMKLNSFAAAVKSSTKKTTAPYLSQKEAIKKIKKLDKKVISLVPCNNTNTVVSVVNKYSKKYFMFLANYGTKEEAYTAEYLYLVDKKTGAIYTLEVDGVPVPFPRKK